MTEPHMKLRTDKNGKVWFWNHKTEQWEYDAQLAKPFEKHELN